MVPRGRATRLPTVAAKTPAVVGRNMPTAHNGDVRLQYRSLGESGAGTVAFVPDAGCGAWQWAWQAPALAGRRQSLVYYPRGTGPSDAPPGPYDVETLARDLDAVLGATGDDPTTVVGAGFGGLVALAHARQSGRADRLVLLGTGATGERFATDPLFAGPASLDGLLGADFLSERPADRERIEDWRREEDATGEAADAYRAAIESADLGDHLVEVTAPTLVLHGDADPVVPVAAGRSLAEALPRGEFEPVRDGHHWFFIERSRAVSDRIDGVLPGTND